MSSWRVGAVLLGVGLLGLACGGGGNGPGPTATQMAKNGGDNQVAAAGAVLAPLSVIVTDANNNPVAGITISWAAVGGGSVSAPTSLTDVNGIATITRTLGPNAGGQTTTATKAGLTGSPLTFNAVSQIQGATQMSLSAGNNQTDTVLATLGTSLAVLVRDQNNAAVQNVTVNWSATGGSVSAPTSQTNASGIATINYTLGSTAGPNTATATVTGLQNSPVSFAMTANAGAAAVLAVSGNNNVPDTILSTQNHAVIVKDNHNNVKAGVTVTWVVGDGGGNVSNAAPVTDASGIASITRTFGSLPGTQTDTAKVLGLTGSPVVFSSAVVAVATQMAKDAGDNQIGAASAALGTAISVIIRDAAGNPFQGTTVNWAAVGGGTVSAPTSISDGSGIASITRTLGPNAGTQSTTATVTGLTGSPLSFAAVAQVQGATQMALNAGNAQTDTVLATLGTNLSVIVKDQNSAVVQGVTVNWAATGGSVSAPTSITDAGGVASIGYTLGATAGAQTASATVTGLQGSPVGFTMTANAGVAATMALDGGNNQTGTVSTALPTQHTVIVKDSHNNPVTGVTVTWVVGDGGGNVSSGSPVTAATGIAGVTRTLGPSAGTHTDTAKVGGLTGSPVIFSATANAPTGAAITVGGVGNVFTPDSLDVTSGQLITWTWAADLHNVTWLTGPAALPANSGDKLTADTYTATLTTAGRYTYRCTNHLNMNGVLIVH